MQRNLYERIEVVFPLKDPQLCERICTEVLSSYLADTRKARILGPDGTYARPRSVRNGHGFSVQEHLMRVAAGNTDARMLAVRAPQVVYTAADVKPGPVVQPPDESDAQDTANAGV
jgi:polyphosphate kinase